MRRHADWFRQARRKLESARWDIQGGFHEDACFSAQQAAELAARALLESQGRIELSHSVYQLLQTLSTAIEELAARTRQRLGIERTPTGWRIAPPDLPRE
jgi:HEPN domain-containing protein